MISARQVGYVSPTIEDMTIQNILIRQDKKVLTDTHKGQDLFEHRFIGILERIICLPISKSSSLHPLKLVYLFTCLLVV